MLPMVHCWHYGFLLVEKKHGKYLSDIGLLMLIYDELIASMTSPPTFVLQCITYYMCCCHYAMVIVS